MKKPTSVKSLFHRTTVATVLPVTVSGLTLIALSLTAATAPAQTVVSDNCWTATVNGIAGEVFLDENDNPVIYSDDGNELGPAPERCRALLGGDDGENNQLDGQQVAQQRPAQQQPTVQQPPTQEQAGPVNAQQITELLNAHNKWRREVGINQDLTWSAQMANLAMDWGQKGLAQGCANLPRVDHRPDDRGGKGVGENIAKRSAWPNLTVSLRGMVDQWGNEKQDYNYTNNKCADGKKCGHYTQIVWRDTREVGCGVVTCTDNGEEWKHALLVCNYMPAGNIVGQKPY